jgi:hypothetical protein
VELIAKRVGIENVRDGEVLIDIPKKRAELEAELDLMVWDKHTNSIHPFTNYSQIARATYQQYQSVANRSRIFVSRRLADKCDSHPSLRGEIIDLVDGYARRA